MSSINAIDQGLAPKTAAVDAPQHPAPERLKALSTQFESMLVAQMLQQMRASMFDEGEDTGLGSGPLSDTLFAELSLAICRAGGVGLADSMMAPLQRETGVSAVAEQPARAMETLAVASLATTVAGDAVPTLTPPSLSARISSKYGWRRDPIDESEKFHRGIDIALPLGHDVPTAQPGKVTFAGEIPGYGQTVVIEHADQLATRYAHLSQIAVKVGEAVTAGQVIAKSGATGRATGPHLHFEVMEAGKTVNPSERLATYTTGGPQKRN